VVVGADEELYSPGCLVDDLNWVSVAAPPVGEALPCKVKIRYNMTAREATVIRTGDDTAEVRFAEPQRAVAPGQAAVFYGVEARTGRVLGGGRIVGRTGL